MQLRGGTLTEGGRWRYPCKLSLHTDLAWVCLLVPISDQQHASLISFEGDFIKHLKLIMLQRYKAYGALK